MENAWRRSLIPLPIVGLVGRQLAKMGSYPWSGIGIGIGIGRLGGGLGGVVRAPRAAAVDLAARARSRALSKGFAVAGPDDPRPVARVAETRRVLDLVAALAGLLRNLELDVARRRVRVQARGAGGHLALHVAAPPPEAAAARREAGATRGGPVDAADPAGLLPARDVALG